MIILTRGNKVEVQCHKSTLCQYFKEEQMEFTKSDFCGILLKRCVLKDQVINWLYLKLPVKQCVPIAYLVTFFFNYTNQIDEPFFLFNERVCKCESTHAPRQCVCF